MISSDRSLCLAARKVLSHCLCPNTVKQIKPNHVKGYIMKPFKNLFDFFGIFLLIFLSGCSSHDVSDYRSLSPKYDFFSFFEGKSWGRGIVFDRPGKMTRQFIGEVFIVFSKEPAFGNGGK